MAALLGVVVANACERAIPFNKVQMVGVLEGASLRAHIAMHPCEDGVREVANQCGVTFRELS